MPFFTALSFSDSKEYPFTAELTEKVSKFSEWRFKPATYCTTTKDLVLLRDNVVSGE